MERTTYLGYSSQHGKYIKKVVDLRELIYEEVEAVESCLEAAKRTLNQIQIQITELRVQLESTTGRTGQVSTLEIFPEALYSTSDSDENLSRNTIIDWGEEDQLQRLRTEIRALKYKIPYSLVYPQMKLTDDSNVVWHPRAYNHAGARDSTYLLFRTQTSDSDDLDMKLALDCNPNFYFLHHRNAPTNPSSRALHASIDSLDRCSTLMMECLKDFPRDVIIKRTLLLNCFRANSPSESEFDDAINNLVIKGFLKTICKRSTSTVSSYWVGRHVQFSLQSAYCLLPPVIHFSPLPSMEQEVLYSNNSPILQKRKSIKVLLLGKWHRSLLLSQHIEVADPDLFYKGMEKFTEVRYISLRDISMIPELPKFITKLKKLHTLDCKSCHNLEVIPDNINKLWRTLTRLDMSGCHLLDHMPPTLSDLLHLEVLKGFHVGEPNQLRKVCTLRDLTKLSKLQKLQINTSVKEFPNNDHLTDLQDLQSLRNLGISWRAFQTHEKESSTFATRARVMKGKDSSGGNQQQFSFHLEKLDLHCVPNTVTHEWLNPVVFNGLKRLYIVGGKFSELGQQLAEPKGEDSSIISKENQWAVEVLRLKHLSELKMNKRELDNLFPELSNLEKVDCPNFTLCCDINGIWLKSTHPHLKLICLEKENCPEEEDCRDHISFCCDHNGIWLKSTHPPRSASL